MEGVTTYGPSPDETSRQKRRRQSTTSPVESPREVGHMRTCHDPGVSSFVGSSSGIHFFRTVRHALAHYGAGKQLRDIDAAEELVPGEDDQLQSQCTPIILWRGDEVSFKSCDLSSKESLDVEFEDLVRWSRPYFDSWHPPFPFLHAPTILKILEKLAMHGQNKLDTSENIIIRSVMSISLADRRQRPKELGPLPPAHLSFRTIDEALSVVQPLIVRSASLSNLQAVVSVQIFLISMLRLNAASRLGGLIVRTLFHLGLHRCPARFGQFGAADIDIRRRLFWSIYCLERYLSQSLGLPLDLRDDDLDVCYQGHELHFTDRMKGDIDGVQDCMTPSPEAFLCSPTYIMV